MSSFSAVIAEHYIDNPFNLKTSVSFKQMSSQSTQFRTASFKFLKTSAGSYSTSNVLMMDGGIGYYNVGDALVTLGTSLGGATTTNDLTLTVSTVNTYGSILTYSVSGTGVSNIADIIFSIGVGSSLFEYSTSLIATRDASDMTKMIKERIMYNEKRAGSTITAGKQTCAGNAEVLWQPQGNQFRLSYLFGKVKCGACANGGGGAFNLNGPLKAS